MAQTKDTLIHEIIWDDGDAKKKAEQWGDVLEKNEKSTYRLAEAFINLGQKLLEFSVEAGANFAKFEDTLGHARRTMNLSREETLALGDSLIQLSARFGEAELNAGVAADELAKITGILGQLGFSAQQVGEEAFLNLTATTAKLSVAFGFSSSKAAEFLGILSNLYNLNVDELENIASSVTVLGNSTVATAQQILDIMQRMGGIAGLLGVTAQEAAGLAATLREAGVSTQVGGTAMSQVFSRLAADVDKFAEVLGKGGLNAEMLRFQIESGNATDALKGVLQAIQNIRSSQGKIAAAQALKDLGLTGVRVQQTLLALSNNLGGLNKNLALSEQAFRENEAVNEAYQAAIDSTMGKWRQFQNLVDVIVKLIGRDLALAFSDFLEAHLIPFMKRFQEWLKRSEGAEKIFGREGLIAKGLDWVGTKLTESQEAIFAWLDVFDVTAPATINALQPLFTRLFTGIDETLTAVLETSNRFTTWLTDTQRTLEDWLNTWGFFLDELAKTGEVLQYLYRPFVDVAINWDKISDGTKRSLELTKEYNRTLGQTTKGTRELAIEAFQRSTWPGIFEHTLEVNKAAMGYGDTLIGLTDTTDFLYKTAKNTWTNLFREVDSGNQLWQRSFDNIRDDSLTLSYNLYQTADAVTNGLYSLATYGSAAEETLDKVAKKSQEVAEATVQTAAGIAAITAAQASISEGLLQTGFTGLSASQLSSLTRTTGVFDARGLANLTTLARTQQQPIAQQAGAAINMATTLPSHIILNVDGEQLTAIVTRKQQDRARRVSSGFGTSTGGFEVGGGGF